MLNAYSKDEIETIWWASKRFDYLGFAFCLIAFVVWYLVPDLGVWRVPLLPAVVLVAWSNWATLSASGKFSAWIPWLRTLPRLRLKMQRQNS